MEHDNQNRIHNIDPKNQWCNPEALGKNSGRDCSDIAWRHEDEEDHQKEKTLPVHCKKMHWCHAENQKGAKDELIFVDLGSQSEDDAEEEEEDGGDAYYGAEKIRFENEWKDTEKYENESDEDEEEDPNEDDNNEEKSRAENVEQEEEEESEWYDLDDEDEEDADHSRDETENEEENIQPSEIPLMDESSATAGISVALNWACEHCTYENPIHVDICGMCSKTTGRIKNTSLTGKMPEMSDRVFRSELDEVANVCFEGPDCREKETMLEYILSETCRAAQSINQRENFFEMIGAGVFWTCQHCTFVNDPNSTTCEMCLQTKPDFDEICQPIEEVIIINQFQNVESGASHESEASVSNMGTCAEPLIREGNFVSENDEYSQENKALARALLADECLQNYEQAELAVSLIRLGFEQRHCITAAIDCDNIDSALSFLQRKCELCCDDFPASEMVAMLYCTDVCCSQCAIDYFSLQIKEKNITDAVCPICKEPNLMDGDIRITYFNQLGSVLKNLLEKDVYELFQRKLRDFALSQDIEFNWCQKCEFGFSVASGVRRLECPECKHVFCIHCKEKWAIQHENLNCEQFMDWKKKNSIGYQEAALDNYLMRNGIQCPKCKDKYDLAKGGCIHFKCSRCKHEFCGGCGAAFLGTDKCSVLEVCKTLGLHAHHPRNCLFYIRDKDPVDLEKLLQTNNVQEAVEKPANSTDGICCVMEQKDSAEGQKDVACGMPAHDKYHGLCRVHYVDYLCALVKQHSLDTVSLMEIHELQQELRRNGKLVPIQEDQETDETYQNRLTKIVQRDIPLK